jgi:hypothetical protein
MIVSPNKGVFFLVTALMCSASLYGAELSSPSSDPLTRVFVGEPNRLTLPPGFPETAELTLDERSCAPPVSDRSLAGAALHTASASTPDAASCGTEDKAGPGALSLRGSLTAAGANQASSPPTGLSTVVQAP